MFQKDILQYLCILIYEIHENKLKKCLKYFQMKNIIRVSFVQIKGIWDVE